MRAASTACTESGTWKSDGSSPTDQPPFSRAEHAHVDQRRHELLDEERVALGPLDDDRPQRSGQLDAEQLVEQAARTVRRQSLELELRTAVPAGPARPTVEQLRPCGREQQQRPVDLADEGFEQVAEIVLRPVHVLDQHDGRPLGDEPVEEVDPRVVEALARDERVQVFGWRQADGEAEERVVAEPLGDDLRRIALEDSGSAP